MSEKKGSLLDAEDEFAAIDARLGRLNQMAVPRETTLIVSLCGNIREECCGTIPDDMSEEIENDSEGADYMDFDDIYHVNALLIDMDEGRNGRITVHAGDPEEPEETWELLYEEDLEEAADRQQDLIHESFDSHKEVLKKLQDFDRKYAEATGFFDTEAARAIENETFPQPYYRRGGYFKGCLVRTLKIKETFDPRGLIMITVEFPLTEEDGVVLFCYRESGGAIVFPDGIYDSTSSTGTDEEPDYKTR